MFRGLIPLSPSRASTTRPHNGLVSRNSPTALFKLLHWLSDLAAGASNSSGLFSSFWLKLLRPPGHHFCRINGIVLVYRDLVRIEMPALTWFGSG